MQEPTVVISAQAPAPETSRHDVEVLQFAVTGRESYRRTRRPARFGVGLTLC